MMNCGKNSCRIITKTNMLIMSNSYFTESPASSVQREKERKLLIVGKERA